MFTQFEKTLCSEQFIDSGPLAATEENMLQEDLLHIIYL